MRRMLVVFAMVWVLGCSDGSDMPTESVLWVFGTPAVTTSDPGSFPLDVTVVMRISRIQNHLAEQAPDGTPVRVKWTFRGSGTSEQVAAETLNGSVRVEFVVPSADVIEMEFTVDNATRDVTVEASVDGEVRLVGG